MHRGTFDQTDACDDAKSDQIADDHDAIAHQKGNHKLPGCHGMFFDRGHILIPYQEKGKRKAQNIKRNHSHDQKDREIIPPLRKECECKALRADLQQQDDGRADEHADADA